MGICQSLALASASACSHLLRVCICSALISGLCSHIFYAYVCYMLISPCSASALCLCLFCFYISSIHSYIYIFMHSMPISLLCLCFFYFYIYSRPILEARSKLDPPLHPPGSPRRLSRVGLIRSSKADFALLQRRILLRDCQVAAKQWLPPSPADKWHSAGQQIRFDAPPYFDVIISYFNFIIHYYYLGFLTMMASIEIIINN